METIQEQIVQKKDLVLVKEGADQFKLICDKLDKYGGFEMFGTTLEGVKGLNPTKEARRDMFLLENKYKEDRKKLLHRLKLWTAMLSEDKQVEEYVEFCEKRSNDALSLLNINVKKAINEVKSLEKAYRTMAMFYKNANSDKIKNITILNASPEQIQDLDNPLFIDAVSSELNDKFDRLDLMNNYSLLVIPGYLGSKMIIDKWARMAHENKVMLVTDFIDLETPDDVMDIFEEAKLTGADEFRANVMLTCNYIVGRGAYEYLGENKPLMIPPSTALAGRMYDTTMSQVAAGRKFGAFYETEGVCFDLKANEIAALEKQGLVPVVYEFGQVMAFSGKTLFNGNNIGKQVYSVVRVFDWVTKCIMDYLNRMLFQNININTMMDIRRELVKFLDDNKGATKLIEKFNVLKFERDPKKKDRVFVDIHITPFFPARNFVIKLQGTKGDDPDSPEWNADYEMA